MNLSSLCILKSLIFYVFAILIVMFAVYSLFANKIVYAVISAISLFITTSGIFFLLGADYNAVIQILIYGIAIPIIFVLSIMFTADKLDKKINITFSPRFFIAIGSIFILFSTLIYLIATSLSLDSNASWLFTKQTMSINKYQMFNSIASGLFTDYAFAFAIFSILLVVIIVGFSTLNLLKEKSDD